MQLGQPEDVLASFAPVASVRHRDRPRDTSRILQVENHRNSAGSSICASRQVGSSPRSAPRIALELDVGHDLPLALADTNQVKMAILNLAVDAKDAMPGSGRLVLSARLRSPGRDHPTVAEGSYIVIAVADDGAGMSEETRLRAIEPFFSTKGIGKGTGLGLSMAHGLVAQLGGALTIESVADEGTTVSLWVPLSGTSAAIPGRAAVSEPMVAGIALLVSDEDVVRASTADILAEIGFEVIEARSGEEALAALRQARHVDVLVTDHLMPEMTGVELARTVLTERPGLPVLVVSGYSDAIGIEAGFPRLKKPFRHADLATKLANLLAQAPDPQNGFPARNTAGQRQQLSG